MKKLFYNSYITPILDYGCIIWKHGKSSDINRISKIQKRIARVILSKPLRSNSNDNFRALNWLSFRKRSYYFTAIMVFKTINGLVPSYMDNLIKISNNQHYGLRSNSTDIAHVSIPKTNYLKKTFSYSGMAIWNSLPLHIRNISSINAFKRNLREYLLHHDQF